MLTRNVNCLNDPPYKYQAKCIRKALPSLRIDCSHFGRMRFDGGATRATAKSLRSEIRSDHKHCCDELCHKGFDCWKNGEPESHPSRDVRLKRCDRGSGDPLRELHFLR